jgi:hypothetical protein
MHLIYLINQSDAYTKQVRGSGSQIWTSLDDVQQLTNQ